MKLVVYILQFICLIDKHLYAIEVSRIIYCSFLSGTRPAIEILILLSPVSLEMVSIATEYIELETQGMPHGCVHLY